jgi:hypothetical protein
VRGIRRLGRRRWRSYVSRGERGRAPLPVRKLTPLSSPTKLQEEVRRDTAIHSSRPNNARQCGTSYRCTMEIDADGKLVEW